MTEYQFNDLMEDGEGQLWRYDAEDRWYLQTEQQDGYEPLEEIPGPHRLMVLIAADELEQLREEAWMYRDLCD